MKATEIARVTTDKGQRELFALDSPLYGDISGERSVMAFPFFALTKVAHMKVLKYRGDQVSIDVRPSANGIATIYDKEVVLYIASLMITRLEAGDATSQDFVFTAHDFFRVTGASPSARAYDRLRDALERLQGTQIRTNIEAGGEGEEGWFSWLSEAQTKYVRGKSGEKRLRAVRVKLCDWLHRAILKDRRILTYHPGYFRLGPIERRLYELARSCDRSGPYEMELEPLRHQVGSNDTLRGFKKSLQAITAADNLPEFRLRLDSVVATDGASQRGRPKSRTMVTIVPRPLELEEPSPVAP